MTERKCDNCKHRSAWRTAFFTRGGTAVADCLHPDWPKWWKARGERPIVMPGAGFGCHKFERNTMSKQSEAKAKQNYRKDAKEREALRAALAGLVQVYVVDGAATTPASDIGDAWKAAQRALLRA